MKRVPVRITAHMLGPYQSRARGGAVQLDGILAFFNAPVGNRKIVPIYMDFLHRLWLSPNGGRPLWAVTPLMPTGNVSHSTVYEHGRYPSDRTRLIRPGQRNANLKAGRWKSKRMALSLYHADQMTALAIADLESLRAQLDAVTHLGGRGAHGYGRVGKWSVSPWDTAFSDAEDAIRHARYMPEAALSNAEANDLSWPRHYVPWTPPYWYAPWWDYCRAPPDGPVDMAIPGMPQGSA